MRGRFRVCAARKQFTERAVAKHIAERPNGLAENLLTMREVKEARSQPVGADAPLIVERRHDGLPSSSSGDNEVATPSMQCPLSLKALEDLLLEWIWREGEEC